MPELFLTIPCAIDGKRPSVEPIHVYLGDDTSGPSVDCRPDFIEAVRGVPAARTCWECPHCHVQFRRHGSAEKHMGLVMNVPAGCRVMKAQDEKGRQERKENKNGR